MKSEPSRTFIGSVLCVDLVGYSKRTVDEQIEVKSAFNHLLSQVIKGVRPDDRIILDTGDGAAVTFLGDPDECLKVGLELRDRLMEAAESLGSKGGEGPVRIGMNLGPLRVALDMNGHPNIIGDGLIAAERVMAFAQPGQIVASRGFHEMVSRLSEENGAMFHYEGKHTDKNAREHDIYIVEDRRRVRRAAAAKTAERRAKAVAELQAALDPEAQPAAANPVEVPPDPVPASRPAPAAKPAATPQPAPAPKPAPAVAVAQIASRASDGAFVAFLRSPWKVWTAAIALLALIFVEAMMLDRKSEAAGEKVATAMPGSAPVKAPVESKPSTPEPREAPVEAKPPPAALAPSAVPKSEPPKVEPPKTEPAQATSKAESPRKSEPPPPPPVTPAKAEHAPAKAEKAKPEPAPTKGEKARTDTPAKSERPRPEPEPRMAAAKPTATVPPPQPEPVPPPPPASQAPPPAPAPTQIATAATPLARVPVQFPKAAAQQGLEAGTVRARLAINAEGRVTNVTVLGSSSRLFDREAIRALEEWRFNAGAAQRSYEVEIEFKR